MNRALLVELQRQRIYPSVTLLLNTTPNTVIGPADIATARRLAENAENRLDGDVPDDVRTQLSARMTALIEDQAGQGSTSALALCVSPDYTAAVRLGRTVTERVVIDDTFATRDLVADLNRTALYRVLTISERKTRLLVGDRARLVEERTETWPMARQEDQSTTAWARAVAQQLSAEQTRNPMPTVIAGVDRTIRKTLIPELVDPVGFIPGNHDRTSWAELHNAAWPLITDWLRADATRAAEALTLARSARRFAGGIDEIWPLAKEGRVQTLVVEEHHAVPARLINGQLQHAEDRESPDVVDDIVDEAIEAVLLQGGNVVIVPDGDLLAHGRIAAVLRY